MTLQASEQVTGLRRFIPGLASILYAAVGALFAYALFGTCRDLNMGAESTVAIMAAAAVAPLVTGPEDVIELTSLAALLVGGWCMLGFVFRLGFISDFLSRPILAGYVFGSSPSSSSISTGKGWRSSGTSSQASRCQESRTSPSTSSLDCCSRRSESPCWHIRTVS